MFWPTLSEIKSVVRDVLNDGEDNHAEKIKLTKEVDTLKRQITDLEHKKGLEEKEIEHLVKMKEEKIAIETQKKQLEIDAKYQAEVMKLQTDYHERVIKLLKDEHDKIQAIYSEIMRRLPNVNVALKGEIGNGSRS
jgi:hypothetical protein